jgi:alkanesulfonate monooxygenase SsuD/methylene tetrahydromethanopterin reductase-like flavin-dependent oxidoreductase (luciferase family)
MRLIEDICILDQLTEGRLDYGVGRGAVPVEHAWFGDDWYASRQKFTDMLRIIHHALTTGEASSEGSEFFDFPPMPISTRPYQERIPFWYPGSPLTAGRHGMSLMWPGKIDQEAYEQYLAAWEEHKDDEVRMDGPDDRPRVGYSMVMAIAPTDAEARDIAQRGMSGLVRRTHEAHRFDHLVVPEDECYAAQGPLRAIHANMDLAIQFGHGTPGRVADNLAQLLADGMADYVCLMFPTGDMTIDESRRTLDLFVGEVLPQLQGVVSRT